MTPKRRRLLELIARDGARGRFPTVLELARELGLARESSLDRMLNALVEEGYLEKQGGGVLRGRQRRIFTLAPRAEQLLGTGSLGRSEGVRLPVAGAVAAGPLREAVSEADEWVEAPPMLRARPGDFFLRVEGDSMTGVGILEGDLVLLRPGSEVRWARSQQCNWNRTTVATPPLSRPCCGRPAIAA